MKTNEIFNFRRFGKYFASDFRTCAANYGLSLLTIAILTPIATYALIAGFTYLMAGSWEGPQLPVRSVIYGMMMLCMVVTMPVKCYGKITEKRYGTSPSEICSALDPPRKRSLQSEAYAP